ncbi:XRE family transcriptional regulator [Brevundimonas sp. GN22]
MSLEKRPNPAKLPIGSRIRARRKELSLTLQELASRSGLSAPFISQAERNLTTPSVWSLMSLAKGLEIDISHFMEWPVTDEIVFRADDPKLVDIESPVTYTDLSSEIADRKMDAILVRIPPGFAFPPSSHDGEIFRYVVKGKLTAIAGEVHAELGPGDGMHFDGRVTHYVRNDSGDDVLLLYVGTPAVLKGV